MRKKGVWVLLAVSLGLVMALQGAAQTAPTETQPQVQAPSALTKPSTPTCPPPCLSAEKEAALVEVRKILKEARQVAEGIEISQGDIQAKTKAVREMILKDLQAQKNILLESIERAQFRSGDFSSAAVTKQPWSLALAQVRYGHTRDAVQSASRDRLGGDTLLVLVDALIRTGAMEGAITVAETDVAKEGVSDSRQREQATILSLIARRQYESGDPVAHATLHRAVQTAQAMKHLPDKYPALIHVARAQAVVGDRTASAETFRQAIRTLLAIEGGKKAGGLWQVAKVQAEVGDLATSEQTFQQAIQLSLNQNPPTNTNIYGCIAWAQAVSGQREAASHTFQLMFRGTENLPPEKRVGVLIEIGNWQQKVGEGEAVAETIQRALQNAQAIEDTNKRAEGMSSITALAIRTGNFKRAIEIMAAIENNEIRIRTIAWIARALAVTKEPFGTKEVYDQLVEGAMAVAKQPLPNDKSRSSSMLRLIAFTQAAAGDLPAALRTIESMHDTGTMETLAYADILKMLITKRDLRGAQKIVASFKEEWVKQGRSIAKHLRDLGKAYAATDDPSAALAWARQPAVSYDKAYALLGVAEGLMDQRGVEDIGKWVPETTRWREVCPSTVEPML